jgi:hypothetical protein
VRKAPSKVDKTRLVDIRTTDMTANDALWWDSRLGPKHAQIRTRADRFWPWSVLLPMCHLVQLAQRRYCRPLVTWARADSDLPPSVRRPNDGRFFFADEPVAETLADALDASR